MKAQILPEALIEQQRKAGRARWVGVTPAERTAMAKRLWRRRVEKHRQSARVLASCLP